ncbi:unnamed protein product [Vicia faba]|uniref:Uncharacterized protein n=1 Tax=Vicia faba TaxID=3906 RepID=A0AAV0YN59_VICFA|nr:unnamed protein product [Vicia faba]
MYYQPNGSMVLAQTNYIKELLTKMNMDEANGVSTPMFSTCKLNKHEEDKLPDPLLYKSTIGALQYVTLTTHDIAFYVNKACQLMVEPLESHWSVVKHLLRYLSGTTTNMFLLAWSNPQQQYSLKAYNDSYWANDLDDRLYTSDSCIYHEPNLVAWSYKKQSLVARSGTNVEYLLTPPQSFYG